jgi:glucose-1-phosphate thymidylyltransferase
MSRKGIILAGGLGTRLYPTTKILSKQLLPVYDKPMIYYPLATLMTAGIKEILIITNPKDLDLFQRLLGNGSQWGIKIIFMQQKEPNGIAEAFILAEEFLNNSPSALILGDNIFYSNLTSNLLSVEKYDKNFATIFSYEVENPSRYGVVELDQSNRILSLEEKPENPKSSFAVTGLYLYDSRASEFAKRLKPSKRGELEITDLNKIYLQNGELSNVKLDKSFLWLDSGTHDSLIQASNFVHDTQKKHNTIIACPEEIAFKKGWIDIDMLKLSIEENDNNLGNYLKNLLS